MSESAVALLAGGMLVAAFLYASVGHGGASAYIAAMALAGIAPAEMRPVALQLNILVSAIATVKFCRAGHFRWPLFWPFAAMSIPAAYLGGAIILPGTAYKILVGLVLLYAAWQLWWSAHAGEELRPARPLSLPLALAIGAGLGVLSGLTGVGGGIFLSPLLLLTGWAGTRQTSAAAAPFILVNSIAALAAGLVRNPLPPPDYAWWLMAAVLAGGWAGAEYGSRRFANPRIRQLLAVVLAVAGGKMVLV
jgi:uncharacterized membrane protein YfcA